MLLPKGSLWGMRSLGEGLGRLCSLFLGCTSQRGEAGTGAAVLRAGAVESCWDWGQPRELWDRD